MRSEPALEHYFNKSITEIESYFEYVQTLIDNSVSDDEESENEKRDDEEREDEDKEDEDSEDETDLEIKYVESRNELIF